MTDSLQLEQDLLAVFRVAPDPERYDQALAATLARVEAEFATPSGTTDRPARRSANLLPRSRRTTRVVAIAIAVLVLMVALAIANPQVVERIFGNDPDRPANEVGAFQAPPADSDLPDLRVFRSEQAPLDEDAAPLLPLLAELTNAPSNDPDGWGEPMEAYARVLVRARVRDDLVRVMAMPTTRGYVCAVTWTGASGATGSCLPELSDALPATFAATDRGDGTVLVSGIARDDVVGVRIVTGARSVDAILGTNAYVWVGAERPTRVIARRSDGSETTLQ